jgi:hypothetical protein
MPRNLLLLQPLLILLLCIAFAVVYGIVHDQITARVCVEYFTIGHPPVFGTEDPTLLGVGWGIIATWWVGVLLGVPLAFAARFGSRPKRSAVSLIRPLAWLMGIAGVCALVAGVIGWLLASAGAVFLVGRIAERVPPERHRRPLGPFGELSHRLRRRDRGDRPCRALAETNVMNALTW